MKFDILGVKVDQVNMSQAVGIVEEWLKKPSEKYYIVTPNVEFIMLALKDKSFQKILNKADLAIPDSARLSWASYILSQKKFITKVLSWPLFLIPNLVPVKQFDVVAGTDLMDQLITQSAKKGYRIGFLGGGKIVAEELKECLLKKYPDLKVSLANSNVKVDLEGNIISSGLNIPETDILFVAFGQGKQEKWIVKNLAKYPVKVMMGVGGAFDYLSNKVPRAPKNARQLGFEWLFRLVYQPWRIKRFLSLFQFVFLVLKKN